MASRKSVERKIRQIVDDITIPGEELTGIEFEKKYVRVKFAAAPGYSGGTKALYIKRKTKRYALLKELIEVGYTWRRYEKA